MVIRPLLIGFATTLKHLFKKPITVNYPEQKFPMFPKFRGKQVLMRDENGLEKCVACGLCSVACPADAIYLEAEENDGTVQLRAGRVQQRRFRLGQAGLTSTGGDFAYAGIKDVGRKGRTGWKGRTTPSRLSRPSHPSRLCRLAR